MAVHRRQAVAVAVGAHAAGHGFVVIPGPRAVLAALPHRQVVHGALAGGGNFARQRLGQGPQHHVDDPRAGLHVAGGHRARAARVDQAAHRRRQRDRPEQAGAGQRVVRQQAAETVVGGGRRHRQRAVDIAAHLVGGAGEVQLGAAPLYPQGDHQRDVEQPLAVVVHHVAEAVLAVGQVRQSLAHAPLAIGVEGVQGRAQRLQAALADQRRQPPGARLAGTGLGGEIGEPGHVQGQLVALAEPRQPAAQRQLPIAFALEPLRGDHQPLLVQGPGHRHGAGAVRADIGVVGPGHGEGGQPLAGEHRRYHRHVGQMGAAQVGVVDHQEVAGAPVAAFHQVRHGVGHGAQVHGNVRGLGAEAAGGVEDGAGKIQPVLDVGRQRAGAQQGAHLVTNTRQAVGENTQLYRVHDSP